MPPKSETPVKEVTEEAEATRRYCRAKGCLRPVTGRLTRGDDLWDFCDVHVGTILHNLVW